MNGNWTKAEFERCVNTAFYVEKKDSVTLDVSRADWRNMEDIMRWAKDLGHEAIEVNSDTIRVVNGTKITRKEQAT